MADQKNEFISWFLLTVPSLIFVALHQIIPAISERLLTSLTSVVIYYSISLLIGAFLFRNARLVRDHEWHRRKHIKKLQKDYAAEDRGVWSKADLAMSELEADASGVDDGNLSMKALQKLDGNIGGLTTDKLTSEITSTDDEISDVSLFSESEHVRRSSARVTGKTGPVESVQGVTHTRSEPEKGLIGGVLDKLRAEWKNDGTPQVTPTSEPESRSIVETQPAADDWYSQEISNGVSNISSVPNSAPMPSSGSICNSCNHANPEGESYCENCGTQL
ncbi:MAG: zinc ribbon domain-containing protein [Candidatus Thalassarchaeaceae archaeon]|nr:zinc ribbon domain-containing protein [Candidatus Thalassarchaeaceae archaeon]